MKPEVRPPRRGPARRPGECFPVEIGEMNFLKRVCQQFQVEIIRVAGPQDAKPAGSGPGGRENVPGDSKAV